MTLTELLEAIRDYYLTRFKDEIDVQIANGFEVITEPELLDRLGQQVTEGFFGTPYRNDLILLKDDEPIQSIMVDTESKLSFDPITLEWSDTLTVTIEPFQWNALTIEFDNNHQNLNWTPIKNWFMDSFEEKTIEEDFNLVVHYISDPYQLNGLQLVDIDLGSGTIEDFETLLDSLDSMNLTNVTLK